MQINFLSIQRNKSFRLPADSQIQVIGAADMFDDNNKGENGNPSFRF